MAVDKNPYREWERQRKYGDYRNTDTQITTFVRQQLSSCEYLTNSNRVNQGPNRNKRVNQAKSSSIIPHVFGSKDMWGWRDWANGLGKDFVVYVNSGTVMEGITPGTSYLPYNLVGGATVIEENIEENLFSGESVTLSCDQTVSVPNIRSTSGINQIPIDSSGLSQSSSNYIMVYNAYLNKFEFKPPGYVLGVSDGDGDPENLDFGSY